jgi:nucleoid-associated protein YgaU
MPNDAKLGLVVGVVLVITVAVIYFRNDAAARKKDETPAATAVKPTPSPARFPARGQTRPTKARTAVQSEESGLANTVVRRHTVQEGDTLASLAERYYGDKKLADELYRANRDQLKGPDELPAGTVLVLPELVSNSSGD